MVFFGTLYKTSVATPADYIQVLKWLILGGRPCICRLLALQIFAGSGDKRIYTFGADDIRIVVDSLGRVDTFGSKVWELDGRPYACEVCDSLY